MEIKLTYHACPQVVKLAHGCLRDSLICGGGAGVTNRSIRSGGDGRGWTNGRARAGGGGRERINGGQNLVA